MTCVNDIDIEKAFVYISLSEHRIFENEEDAVAYFNRSIAYPRGIYRWKMNARNEWWMGLYLYTGELFDDKTKQLKQIAEAIHLGVDIPENFYNVYVGLYRDEGSGKIVRRGIYDTGADSNPSPFLNIFKEMNKESCMTYYLPVDNLDWEDGVVGPMGVGKKLVSEEVDIFVYKGQIYSSVGKETRVVATCKDFYSIEEAVREYIETLRECRSLGWTKDSIFVYPTSKEVCFKIYNYGTPSWSASIGRKELYKYKKN